MAERSDKSSLVTSVRECETSDYCFAQICFVLSIFLILSLLPVALCVVIKYAYEPFMCIPNFSMSLNPYSKYAPR